MNALAVLRDTTERLRSVANESSAEFATLMHQKADDHGKATSQVATLIESARDTVQSLQHLRDLNRRIAENGWIELELTALRDAQTAYIRAQNRLGAAVAMFEASA